MLFKGWALSSLFCTFCLCSDIYFWLLPQPLCWWLEDFSFVKFTTLMFSSTDESLKDETHLLLLWVDSLVTPGFSLLGGCGGHPPWPAENLFIYLSICLSISLSTYPSIHPSIYRSSRKNTTLIFHLIVTAVA